MMYDVLFNLKDAKLTGVDLTNAHLSSAMLDANGVITSGVISPVCAPQIGTAQLGSGAVIEYSGFDQNNPPPDIPTGALVKDYDYR